MKEQEAEGYGVEARGFISPTALYKNDSRGMACRAPEFNKGPASSGHAKDV